MDNNTEISEQGDQKTKVFSLEEIKQKLLTEHVINGFKEKISKISFKPKGPSDIVA